MLTSMWLVGLMHLALFVLADLWYAVFWQPSVFLLVLLASVVLWLPCALCGVLDAARQKDVLMLVLRPLVVCLAWFCLNMLFLRLVDHLGERAAFYWFIQTEPAVQEPEGEPFPVPPDKDILLIPPAEAERITGTDPGRSEENNTTLPYLTQLVHEEQDQLLQYLSSAPEWNGGLHESGSLNFSAYMAADGTEGHRQERDTAADDQAQLLFEWSFYQKDQPRDNTRTNTHWFTPRISLTVYRNGLANARHEDLQRLDAYLKHLAELHGGSLTAALPGAHHGEARMEVRQSAGLTSARGMTGERSFTISAWVNPGELGTVFVRLYELSRNRQVPLRFDSATKPTVGYSPNPSEQYYVRSYSCSPHAGIAGRAYNARVELWFRPWNPAKEERLLLSCPCRMDGQGDYHYLLPSTPMGDMMQLLL